MLLLTVGRLGPAKAFEKFPIVQGAPIVAIDLGGGRAFSAAVAVWRGGRVEAV